MSINKDAAALVQHIELHKSGWHEKTLSRLAVAAVWMSHEPIDSNAIFNLMKEQFKVSASLTAIEKIIESLVSKKQLVRLDSGALRIPDEQRTQLDAEVSQAEKVESDAKSLFAGLIHECCPGLDIDQEWKKFDQEFLLPLVAQVGANAYRLISGEGAVSEKTLLDGFLARFPESNREAVRELIAKFLDPKKAEARHYISRALHACFCVESGGLPKRVIETINRSIGKPVRFRMFVDTNFLFSLLALHENPSNEAAIELRELIVTLKGNPTIELFITPRTIEEAKSRISRTKSQIATIPARAAFSNAALEVKVSGIAARFFSERLNRGGKLSVDDWFDPYLHDFVPMARERGVEIYNEKLDKYATAQKVVDDIEQVREFEQKRYEESKRKSYGQIAHDMMLWHFVNDLRPGYVESPADAGDWILTVDYRFLGFDEYKHRQSGGRVPICIHPADLIPLLQFWVPRTAEFEEAMLGSMRLPFLFQNFDVDSEIISLKILQGIGRFENAENLSQETITKVILNKGLRDRIKADHDEKEEVALIRDTLIAQEKARADAEAGRSAELERRIQERDLQVRGLESSNREKDTRIEELLSQVAQGSREALETRSQMAQQEERLFILENDRLQAIQRKEGLLAALKYLGILVIVGVISVGSGLAAAALLTGVVDLAGRSQTAILSGILAFIFIHLILEIFLKKSAVAKTWMFTQVRRFRVWLWSIIVLGFVAGVIGNLYANQIQAKLDEALRKPPAAEALKDQQ